MKKADEYAEFVDHPRYGRRPHITGLNPSPDDEGVHLHWMTVEDRTMVTRTAVEYEAITGQKWPYGDSISRRNLTRKIPNTAIAADLARQTPATLPITHYFDIERCCEECGRPFLFFAREQKHWYEELGFGLDSDCIRCVECRKWQQGIAQQREVYESLFHVPNKTAEQSLQMADACLTLIESAVFAKRQTERVRMLLKSIPDEAAAHVQKWRADLIKRLIVVETV